MSDEVKNFDPTGGALLFVAFISIIIWLFCLVTYFGGDTGTMPDELKAVLILTGIAIFVTALKSYCACNEFAFAVLLMVALGVILAAFATGFYVNLAIGIIFIIMMVWGLLIGVSKSLTIILIMTALIFIFGGAVELGGDIFVLLKGLVALVNSVFAVWLSLALVCPDKVKVF